MANKPTIEECIASLEETSLDAKSLAKDASHEDAIIDYLQDYVGIRKLSAQMLEALRPLAALADAVGDLRIEDKDFYLWVQSHRDHTEDTKLTLADARAASAAIAAAEAGDD